mgnify:CR=1|jgi:hypothetical protein
MRLLELRFYLKSLVSTEMRKCHSVDRAECDNTLKPFAVIPVEE